MRFEKQFPGMRTHLIQRLTRPYDPRPASDTSPLAKICADEVFSFGVGKPRGGLSKQAFELLKPVWAWDYMGSAEFEFGAIPDAFAKMFEKGDFEAFHIEAVGYPLTRPNGWEHDKTRVLKQFVYVFCPLPLKDYATKVISVLAETKYPPNDQTLKEYPRLWNALFDPEFRAATRPVQGWFELDNGFLFFSSKTMWQNFMKVIGLEAPEAPDEIPVAALVPEPKKAINRRKVMR